MGEKKKMASTKKIQNRKFYQTKSSTKKMDRRVASLFTSTTAISMLESIISSYASAKNSSISGLTPCTESKAFVKRKNQELKELQKRMKKYEVDSSPAIALKATIERTERRFNNYGKSGLLCGNDGLPHLIADPGLALKNGRANDVFIPTLGFLYFAGWLGHSGRLYLEATRDREKEIILDVPLAIAILAKAIAWPIMVSQLVASDTLVEKDENITVSPR